MNFSALTEKIEFWGVVNRGQDGQGNLTGDLVKLFGPIHAEVHASRGMIRMMGLQNENVTPHTVKTRYYPQIAKLEEGEIRWEGQKLRIAGMPENVNQKNTELVFYANA